MSVINEEPEEGEPEFRWGRKKGKGGKKKDVQFYESFTYDGEEYALHDCVYLHVGKTEPYIGKILKIWENGDKNKGKRVKIQWFFYPFEIERCLDGVERMKNELFFASGNGTGLANLNPLEAIAGKCSILCISKDSRNLQPSAEELQMADFVFYRTFDVGNCTISDQFGEAVGGLEVKFVFNRKEDFDRLHSISKREEIAFRNPPNPQASEILKLDEGLHNVLEKESSALRCVQAKHGSVEETEAELTEKESAPLPNLPIVYMNPDCKEVMEKTCSPGAKYAGGEVSAVEVEFPDSELHIDQVQDEVKFTNKSSTSDETPSIDGKASSRIKTTNNTANSEKDSPRLILGRKVGSKSDFGGRERAKLDKHSSGLINCQAKKSADLSKEKRKFGDDVAQEITDTSTKGMCDEGPIKKAKFDGNKTTKTLDKILLESHEDSIRKQKLDDNNTDNKLKTIPVRSDGASRKKVDENDKVKKIFGESDAKSTPKHVLSYSANHDINDTTPCEDLCQMNGPTKKGKIDDCTRKSKVVENDENGMANKLKCAIETTIPPTILTSKDDNHGTKEIQSSCKVEGLANKKRDFIGKSKVGDDDDKSAIKKVKRSGGSEMKSLLKPLTSHANKGKLRLDNGPSKDHPNEKKAKLSNDDMPKTSLSTLKGNGKKVEGQKFEVLQRPNEKTNWIKLPWMDRIKSADEKGGLVLLLNLPPFYTSGEVEDIIWHAFEENCTAKMLPHTATSNPNSGQAFAIFKTREAANSVVKRLDDGCLMLANRRPLVACIPSLPKSVKQTTFFGHLGIDKARIQIQRELKDAVSTSHYSQNNTVEYEMAMLWCFQQSKSENVWKALYEQQLKDMTKLKAALKSK